MRKVCQQLPIYPDVPTSRPDFTIGFILDSTGTPARHATAKVTFGHRRRITFSGLREVRFYQHAISQWC